MIATSAKTLTLGVALLLSAAGARAQTADPPPTVTFTGINDAVPGRFFDAATSAPEPTDPNTLVIGLHTGTDPTTWKDRDFKASMLPFSYPSAADTISFTIHAPAGYYVATVTYHETLVLGDSRTGRSFASTQMVVNGIALQEPFIDISASAVRDVAMSITTSLVAANAEARLLAGRVSVQVLPLVIATPETAPAVDAPPTATADVPPTPEVAPVVEGVAAPEIPQAPVAPPALQLATTPDTPAPQIAPALDATQAPAVAASPADRKTPASS